MKKTVSLLLVLCLALSLVACAGSEAPAEKQTSLTMALTYMGTEYQGVYEGEIDNGVAQGNGTFTATTTDGSLVCTGSFANGIPASPAEATDLPVVLAMGDGFLNGSYTGPLTAEGPEGFGSFIANGPTGGRVTYDGQWKAGNPEGSLTAEAVPLTAMINGEAVTGTYTGTISAAGPDGKGVFTAEELVLNTGWTAGAPSGEGTATKLPVTMMLGETALTGCYDGALVNGMPHGNGSFVTPDGSITIQDGVWSEGSLQEGNIAALSLPYSVTFLDKEHTGTYAGATDNGLPHGDGTFTAEGFTYTGSWANGNALAGHVTADSCTLTIAGAEHTGSLDADVDELAVYGQGTLTATDPEGNSYTYTGEWAYNAFNGQGTLTYADGNHTVQAGTFVQGVFTPTVAEFYQERGTMPGAAYTISEKAAATLTTYPGVFENRRAEKGMSYIAKYKFEEFAANPDQYGEELLRTKARVVSLETYTVYGQEHCFLVVKDGANNLYYVNFYGQIAKFRPGATVVLTALPLGLINDTDAQGQAFTAMGCAGVSCANGAPREEPK